MASDSGWLPPLALPPVREGGGAAQEARLPQQGVRQRLASAKAQSRDVPDRDDADLPFNASMKRDWGKGKLSSVKVIEYATGAHEQGARGLERMPRGTASQNAQRALMAAFGRPKGTPDFTWAEIPTKRGKIVHPFLLPHEWFRCLFLHAPSAWETSVRGPKGAAVEFWKSMQASSFVSKHPVLDRKDWANAIPIGFHGGAGCFFQSRNQFICLLGIIYLVLALHLRKGVCLQ